MSTAAARPALQLVLLLGAEPRACASVAAGHRDLALELPHVELGDDALSNRWRASASVARREASVRSAIACSWSSSSSCEVAGGDVAHQREHVARCAASSPSRSARAAWTPRRVRPQKSSSHGHVGRDPQRVVRDRRERAERDLVGAAPPVGRQLGEQLRPGDPDLRPELPDPRHRGLQVAVLPHRESPGSTMVESLRKVSQARSRRIGLERRRRRRRSGVGRGQRVEERPDRVGPRRERPPRSPAGAITGSGTTGPTAQRRRRARAPGATDAADHAPSATGARHRGAGAPASTARPAPDDRRRRAG